MIIYVQTRVGLSDIKTAMTSRDILSSGNENVERYLTRFINIHTNAKRVFSVIINSRRSTIFSSQNVRGIFYSLRNFEFLKNYHLYFECNFCPVTQIHLY